MLMSVAAASDTVPLQAASPLLLAIGISMLPAALVVRLAAVERPAKPVFR